MLEVLGFVGALVIGVVLGLIGGGGSILTVPLLVYVLAVEPVKATAYSLFIVGITALVGTIRNLPKKMVDFKTAIVFAIPAFIAVYLTRKFMVPAIPDILYTSHSFILDKNMAIMLFFALIMLMASYSMIKNKGKKELEEEEVQYNYPLILMEGFVVGVLTGLVGAGGGFLIIPALVLLAKLPMKKAVATSLLIIAVKSLIGFIGDIQNLEIDWGFLMLLSGLSVIGIFVGIYLNTFIHGKKLKKAFGYFVLIMAVVIIFKELVF